MGTLKEIPIGELSIDQIDEYLNDKGLCTVKITELEYLENKSLNHPG